MLLAALVCCQQFAVYLLNKNSNRVAVLKCTLGWDDFFHDRLNFYRFKRNARNLFVLRGTYAKQRFAVVFGI